ncbi:MAG: hypothetical protein ACJ8DT_01550, partial [Microvirga sp.]
MKTLPRSLTAAAATAAVIATAIIAAAGGTSAQAATRTNTGPTGCRGIERLTVPGAERLEAACLNDLTTTGTVGTGHTDSSGFLGFGGLSVLGAVKPSAVPGIQLDGYFPDTSILNPTHGWNHDSQFVI